MNKYGVKIYKQKINLTIYFFNFIYTYNFIVFLFDLLIII